jgi:hypothetical protein
MKYKYHIDDIGYLTDKCSFFENGSVMIGSATCIEDCGNCISFNYDKNEGAGWIVCKKLNKKFRERKLNRILNEN